MKKKGFSLIETLVVVGLFAVISIVVAQATAVSLTGSRKADASTTVRENLAQTMNVIERQIRSARSINLATCTGGRSLDFVDQDGVASRFSCNSVSSNCSSTSNSYIDHNGARLTAPESTCISACSFSCEPAIGTLPPTVKIVVEAVNKDTSGVEGASVRLETSITLRAY